MAELAKSSNEVGGYVHVEVFPSSGNSSSVDSSDADEMDGNQVLPQNNDLSTEDVALKSYDLTVP